VHGRAGGEVCVTLHAPAGGQGSLLVVEDDGPGIPEGQRERIFEPFARLPGTDRPGSGLGLTLVAQQVALHGAEIAVDGSSLGGARFSVQLPAEPATDGSGSGAADPAG